MMSNKRVPHLKDNSTIGCLNCKDLTEDFRLSYEQHASAHVQPISLMTLLTAIVGNIATPTNTPLPFLPNDHDPLSLCSCYSLLLQERVFQGARTGGCSVHAREAELGERLK